MAKLAVGPALAYFHEPEPLKERDELTQLENRDRARHSGDLDRLDTDKLRLESWLAILQEHLDDFLQVALQLAEGFTLAVRYVPAVEDEALRDVSRGRDDAMQDLKQSKPD